MNNTATNSTPCPTVRKQIGKTTYIVRVHFSQTAKETISFLRLRAFTVTGGFEMATTKSMKIQAEIDKVKAKISEQQARLKELEQKKLEAENSEIVDIVRGMSISLTELPLLFEKLKDGGTLGQSVPKSEEEKEEN